MISHSGCQFSDCEQAANIADKFVSVRSVVNILPDVTDTAGKEPGKRVD